MHGHVLDRIAVHHSSCIFKHKRNRALFSDIRHVPNNQEVYADAATDQSIVVEILELVAEATGEDSAR